MDLYAELDIPRDADETAIRKAYRKASKRAHPDGGGTADKFQRVSTALAVLTDPRRRKAYDETGKIDDRPVDNEKVHIVELAMAAVQAALDAYGDGPVYDDVVVSAIRNLEAQVRQVEGAIAQVRARIKSLSRFNGRFKKKSRKTNENILERLNAFRISEMEGGVAKNEGIVRQLKAATEILKDYTFVADRRDMQQATSTPGFFIHMNLRTPGL